MLIFESWAKEIHLSQIAVVLRLDHDAAPFYTFFALITFKV